jgi:hypothetical protein
MDIDIVRAAVSIVPVPYLSGVFSLFVSICTTIEQVKDSKRQLQALAETTASLLMTLDKQHRSEDLSEIDANGPLANLHR